MRFRNLRFGIERFGIETSKIILYKPFDMNDYFTFAEILKQRNFLKSQRVFESDASMIANKSWTPTNDSDIFFDLRIKEKNVRLCSELKFDFEAQKWTDDKMGLQIFSFIDS